MSLFSRYNYLHQLEQVSARLFMISETLERILLELQNLNGVAKQWNVREINPGDDKVPPAIVRTFSDDQMRDLEELRTGQTEVAMSGWAKAGEAK